MKTQIKRFLDTFFYFNTNEKKGLLGLLFLVIFLQAVAFAYQKYSHQKEVPVLTIVQLDWTKDSSQTNIFVTQYKQKFIKGNRFPKDSIYPSKKLPLRYPVDLNSADSATLVALPKIGSFLAGKIVALRTKLGGFHSLTQLTEIWGFKEDFLYDLEGKIWVDPKQIKYIAINTISLDELQKHPYFKYTLSRVLINYRTQHGNYKNMESIKGVKLVNDSIVKLIAPYIHFK